MAMADGYARPGLHATAPGDGEHEARIGRRDEWARVRMATPKPGAQIRTLPGGHVSELPGRGRGGSCQIQDCLHKAAHEVRLGGEEDH
jgi:hypothetical protein